MDNTLNSEEKNFFISGNMIIQVTQVVQVGDKRTETELKGKKLEEWVKNNIETTVTHIQLEEN